MYVSQKEQLANIRGLLRRSKKAYDKAAALQRELYDLLYEYRIDLDVPAALAENADDLNDAISTYLLYNEVGEKNLMTMLAEALKEANR